MLHAEATPPAEPEALHPQTLAPTRKVLSREGSRPALLKHSLSQASAPPHHVFICEEGGTA